MQKNWSNYFNAFHATVTSEIVRDQRKEKQTPFWTGAESFAAEWAEMVSKNEKFIAASPIPKTFMHALSL